MHDSIRRLEARVASQVMARGRRYWRQGRVLEVTFDDELGEYVAFVDGTANEPYEVCLQERPDGWWGYCDCPAEDPCKHFVAAVLAIVEDQAGATQLQRATHAMREEQHRAAEAMQAWISDCRSTRRGEPGKAGRKQIEFVIDVERGDYGRRVSVAPVAVTLRKRDGAPTRHYPLDPHQPRPRWVSIDDAALLFRIDAAGEPSRHLDARLLPNDEVGAAILTMLVQTGRAHFGSLGSRRLTLGATRRCELRWTIDGTGEQRLTLRAADDADESAAPLTTLPVVPPYFVDEVTGECGPADLGLPQDTVRAAASVPSVPAVASTEIPRAFEATLRKHGLPLPKPIATVVAEDPTFVPVLEAFSEDDTILAQLAFEYAGHRVAAFPPGGVARVLEGDSLAIVARDPVLEAASRMRLHSLGWLPVDDEATTFGVEAPPPPDALIDRLLSLRAEGWTVELDPAIGGPTTPIDGWSVDVRPADEPGWFDVALGIDVDGERIDLLPILTRAIARGELSRDRLALPVPLRLEIGDGRVVELPVDRLQQILATLGDLFDERSGGGHLHALSLGEILRWSWVGDKLRRQLRKLAAPLRRGKPKRVRPPAGFKAKLRDYQRDGLDWLQLLRSADAGGVLADDMGLGKTVQALAHILVEKRAGRLAQPALVVAPRSVLRNWEREAQRFAPSLRTVVYHGPGRERALAQAADLIVTTYALLTRDEALRERDWHIAILDEAQAIKNPQAKVTRAASELRASQRICMTGTPVENHLGELWSIVGFAMPGLLGDWKSFSQRYRRPIETEGCPETMQQLSRRLAPFMLRRTKEQVLDELPPKTEVTQHAILTGAERDIYETIRLTMEKRVRDAMSARGLARSQIVVLDALLKLRQVCCDSRLVDLAAAKRVHRSSKLETLMELLVPLLADGRRVLLFSQFTSMLALITARLDAVQIAYGRITGRTRKRQAVIDAFQAGEFPVLLVSLKAGGTGLNLTAADTVIHYDPWWNPAVEDQATDRAYRIGQDKPVTVYRLVCEGTVEERMLALQERKRRLADAVAAGANARSRGGLSLKPEDVQMLLAPLGE